MRDGTVPSPGGKEGAYELEAALESPRTQSGTPEYTAEEEAAIIRKLDFRLLPFLLLLYTFSVLDRSNLGKYKACHRRQTSRKLDLVSSNEYRLGRY